MSLKDERGFTLVELLTAATLSLVVLTSAVSFLNRSERVSKEARGRIDSAQRGRVAMEQVSQRLRNWVCTPDAAPPIISASSDHVTFYADLDNDINYDPEQWRLSAVRRPDGRLEMMREERWRGVTPPVAAGLAPNHSRNVIDGISDLTTGGAPVPVFRYYTYANAADPEPTVLPAGTVADAMRRRIVRIDVAFSSNSSERVRNRDLTSNIESSVFARTVRRNAGIPTFDCSG